MVVAGTAAGPPARLAGRLAAAWVRPRARWIVVGVALLTGWSVWLKAGGLRVSYWIDEGISVGVASHHLSAIPSVLREDGSPPLYYVLLHAWIGLFGAGEPSTHALSLLFGLLCIPAALWACGSVFGLTAGLVAAAVTAVNPFVSAYSVETRMYSLVLLLAILATGAFLQVFVMGRQRFAVLLGATLSLLLYTHAWGLFLAAGMALGAGALIATAPDRRGLLRAAGVAAAVVIVTYGPWIPTLVFQSQHTAAPWSLPPTWRALIVVPTALLGRPTAALPLIGAALAALVLVARRERTTVRGRALLAIVLVSAATMVCAYLVSKVSGAWATRYFSIFLGPLIVVFGAALARARWVGALALAVALVQWGIPHVPPRDAKSNVRPLAARLAPLLPPGALVISTHPEQVPVLAHYLPAGLRYATTLGPVADPRVMDWRDALRRLRAATPATALEPVLGSVAPGGRVALVLPRIDRAGWVSPWLKAVGASTQRWALALRADRRFRLVAAIRRHGYVGRRSGIRMRALVFVRTTRH